MLTSFFPMLKSNQKTAKIALIGVFSSIFLLVSHASSLAEQNQKTYKLRLNVQSSIGSADGWNLNGAEANEEWVVISLKNSKEFKIYHTTYVENKTWGTRRWFDHPVTGMRICLSDGFEKKDCKIVESDTTIIPEGKYLHDLSIDFKYSESGRSFTKNITIAKDAKPE